MQGNPRATCRARRGLLRGARPAAEAKTSIYRSNYTLAVSETLPGSLLPSFRFQLSRVEAAVRGADRRRRARARPVRARRLVPRGDLGPRERGPAARRSCAPLAGPVGVRARGRRGAVGRRRERAPPAHDPAAVGARVWSVFDKRARGAFANPAHQPANIGVLRRGRRAASSSTGAGIIGHSVFSESPAFVGVSRAPRGGGGDALGDDDALGGVVRVWGPTASTRRVAGRRRARRRAAVAPPQAHADARRGAQGYWWTCVAVPATPETRVLVPRRTPPRRPLAPRAARAAGVRDGRRRRHAGHARAADRQLVARRRDERRLFMGPLALDSSATPNYIAYADLPDGGGRHGGGRGCCPSRGTRTRNGTKFFTWGQNGPGRFMQDFLGGASSSADPAGGDGARASAIARGAGPAFTQMQTFTCPPAACSGPRPSARSTARARAARRRRRGRARRGRGRRRARARIRARRPACPRAPARVDGV